MSVLLDRIGDLRTWCGWCDDASSTLEDLIRTLDSVVHCFTWFDGFDLAPDDQAVRRKWRVFAQTQLGRMSSLDRATVCILLEDACRDFARLQVQATAGATKAAGVSAGTMLHTLAFRPRLPTVCKAGGTGPMTVATQQTPADGARTPVAGIAEHSHASTSIAQPSLEKEVREDDLQERRGASGHRSWLEVVRVPRRRE